ncbi:MAG: LytTR family transcriptional regulator DNA-binding domain-containing protein [Cyclobacteriaceae bacterium]|nr:LytTR family transcriptional regulator DNA-binding domain-containing protein [Cyclobacteriaceae bacterium HetDA_MAG_MS6]
MKMGKRHISMANNITIYAQVKRLVSSNRQAYPLIAAFFVFWGYDLHQMILNSSSVSSRKFEYCQSCSSQNAFGQGIWDKQKPDAEHYWIRTEIALGEGEKWDHLLMRYPGQYRLFWDGYPIGTKQGKSPFNVSAIFNIDKQLLTAGNHHILLEVLDEVEVLPGLFRPEVKLSSEKLLISSYHQKAFQLLLLFGLLGLALTYWFFNHSRHKSLLIAICITLLGYICISWIALVHDQPLDWSGTNIVLVMMLMYLALFYKVGTCLNKPQFKLFFWILLFSFALVYVMFSRPIEHLFLATIIVIVIPLTTLVYLQNIRYFLIGFSMLVIPFTGLWEIGSWIVITSGIIYALLSELKSEPARKQHTPRPAKKTHTIAKYLLVNSKGEKKMVRLDDVATIKAANNYSVIVMSDGERFLHDKSLSKLSPGLPRSFRRVHKSYIANFDHVQSVHAKPGGGKYLSLENREHIPVGRVFAKELDVVLA